MGLRVYKLYMGDRGKYNVIEELYMVMEGKKLITERSNHLQK